MFCMGESVSGMDIGEATVDCSGVGDRLPVDCSSMSRLYDAAYTTAAQPFDIGGPISRLCRPKSLSRFVVVSWA